MNGIYWDRFVWYSNNMKIDNYPQPQRNMLEQSGSLNRERYVLIAELEAFARRQDLSGEGVTYAHQTVALAVASRLNFLDPAYLHLSVTLPKARELSQAIRAENWTQVQALLLRFETEGPPQGLR